MRCKEGNKWAWFQFIPLNNISHFCNSSLLKKERKNMMKNEGGKKHG
jgi:hypothetical protein